MGKKKNTQWFVYIIKTADDRLYTGITTDPERRFGEHNESRRGAKFFNICRPAKLVFRESHPNRSAATRREIEIKGLSRAKKKQMIKECGLRISLM